MINLKKKLKSLKLKRQYDKKFSQTVRKSIHGPIQAMPVANSEPKSWPSVAPAPMKPNNLEPDWIWDKIKYWTR